MESIICSKHLRMDHKKYNRIRVFMQNNSMPYKITLFCYLLQQITHKSQVKLTAEASCTMKLLPVSHIFFEIAFWFLLSHELPHCVFYLKIQSIACAWFANFSAREQYTNLKGDTTSLEIAYLGFADSREELRLLFQKKLLFALKRDLGTRCAQLLGHCIIYFV